MLRTRFFIILILLFALSGCAGGLKQFKGNVQSAIYAPLTVALGRSQPIFETCSAVKEETYVKKKAIKPDYMVAYKTNVRYYGNSKAVIVSIDAQKSEKVEFKEYWRKGAKCEAKKALTRKVVSTRYQLHEGPSLIKKWVEHGKYEPTNLSGKLINLEIRDASLRGTARLNDLEQFAIDLLKPSISLESIRPLKLSVKIAEIEAFSIVIPSKEVRGIRNSFIYASRNDHVRERWYRKNSQQAKLFQYYLPESNGKIRSVRIEQSLNNHGPKGPPKGSTRIPAAARILTRLNPVLGVMSLIVDLGSSDENADDNLITFLDPITLVPITDY